MSTFTAIELSNLLDLAVKASLNAGKYIVSNVPIQIGFKSSQYDLVTEHDTASEKIIREILSHSNLSILGEELGGSREFSLTWVIDPIDGTNNFVTGSPLVGINIALFSGGEPIIGVTYLPFLDELYTSIKGQGVIFNNKPLPMILPSPANYLPIIMNHTDPLIVANYPKRLIGASSVELAWCARGIFAGVAYEETQPWDVAPGILFIRELGGEAKCRVIGQSIFENGAIVGNKKVVNELMGLIDNGKLFN
jgi:myo-inositol-1(or 4)-monophosphatase